MARAFEDWYRQRALAHLLRRTAVLAARLGVRPAGVLVRDQRRRWGSCSPGGMLRFNWRIVMTPPALIDYVIAHELAHLRSRTHGATYWALVASIVPDHRERRRRLREIGPHIGL
ncbi:MAG: M48 family metallopeptidase [Gemmatimonadetes bacterium]|nr:M48 family metallopeptidase [Gemmatimonadota bacterium]